MILDPTQNNEYEVFWERYRVCIANTVCIGFEELKAFEKEIFGAKSYFLAKEQGHGRPADDLEYPEGLVSDPECEDNPVDRTSSAPPLTDHGSEGCSENGNGATTPQNTRTTASDLGPNIFGEVMPMEIDRESKDLGELEGGFRNTTPEHSPAFVDALGSTNNPVILRRPTPSPISEKGAASGEQAIDSNVLQSLAWRTIQMEMATIQENVSSSLQAGVANQQDDVSAELEAEDIADEGGVEETNAMIEEGVQVAFEELKER